MQILISQSGERTADILRITPNNDEAPKCRLHFRVGFKN